MTTEHGTQADNSPETDIQWAEPKLFKVILHNDDYTTMDFVVDVLTKIFHRDKIEATNIMLDVHNNGSGVAGVYVYDIAVTKKIQTDRASREKGFPLKVTIDEVDNEAG